MFDDVDVASLLHYDTKGKQVTQSMNVRAATWWTQLKH